MSILDPVLRAGDGRQLAKLSHLAAATSALEPEIAALTDGELRGKTDQFRSLLKAGRSETSLLPEAFAVVREAARRTVGMRHFDVQIVGGAALHAGHIAEMGTGEGKTLVATLPAYLNALTGRGVHVVTVNDYLADRDGRLMGQIHRFLGLTVGILADGQPTCDRQDAYRCDITYGTNTEFGFDYLRDNMATDPAELVQRGHHFAIVDEVDSILIDEARTPLVISGPGAPAVTYYEQLAALTELFEEGTHYDVDEKRRRVGILPAGLRLTLDQFGSDKLYTAEHARLVAQLNQAVKARALFRRDRDYAVVDGQVAIIDEHTGRITPGRRYSDGLHQALEAKEHVAVVSEDVTYASVTLQNYFRLYGTLSGMTGTGASEAAEFHHTFGLDVVTIPPNRPVARVDLPDVIYRTKHAKFAAVVDDVRRRHAEGRPVLIGTADVAASEHLSALLTDAGVKHNVLNAKNPGQEATIVAQAGATGAVTVSTGMAGRGTDILLGGTGHGPEADSEARAKVRAAGGLYVIGTERNESRRIDNQLRGRAGRQGDPGTSVFYLSLEDDVIRRFAGASLSRAAGMLGDGDTPIRSKMIDRAVAAAQATTESNNAEQRKELLRYDDVLTKQRTALYANRLRVLTGTGLTLQIAEMARQEAEDVARATGLEVETATAAVAEFAPVEYDPSWAAAGPKMAAKALGAAAAAAVMARAAELPAAEQFARSVMLRVIDTTWRRQLANAEYLKSGAHLNSNAQIDPLVEYQQGAYDMYIDMLRGIRRDIVGYFCYLDRAATGSSGPELREAPTAA